jgi:hypothetical protein
MVSYPRRQKSSSISTESTRFKTTVSVDMFGILVISVVYEGGNSRPIWRIFKPICLAFMSAGLY